MTARGTLFLVIALAVAGCGQTPSDFRPLPSALGDVRGVAMGFEGLLTLGVGQGRYAAWIRLDNGDIVPLGGFNVNADGRPVDSNGNVIDRFSATTNLFKSVSLVITIEPQGIINTTPGAAVILQGPFIDGIAQLAVPAPLFVGQASGSYRVFTPTDGPNTNEGSGLWAVSVNGAPLLTLPPLNNVYQYEGFVIVNGTPLTMARFVDPTVRDFINFFSGPAPAPQFPGEDYLVNAPEGVVFPPDLSGARVLVTLEPIFDDTAGPSQLVILEGTMPANVVGGEIIELVNRTSDFPTGTAAIF